MQTLRITGPDDWHVHLRDGLLLKDTAPATARHFSRALIMPNLVPALLTVDACLAYRERILAALDPNHGFVPYMTLYLNENIRPSEFELAKNSPYILGAKLYPAGATTNSAQGVRSFKALSPLLEIMQQFELVLQIHGEVTQGDIFDREANFIETFLRPLIKNFPRLRIVLEHISTKSAVEFVQQSSDRVAATITPHHLLYNRNHLLAGGIRPHYYCLPILKKESDQNALKEAAISGNPKFFAGTDSAPHAKAKKETACGCAGIYSSPFAIALYAQCFDSLNQMDKLDGFLSHFGAEFYHLPINQTELILKKIPQWIPETLSLGEEQVIPIAAGERVEWSVYESL